MGSCKPPRQMQETKFQSSERAAAGAPNCKAIISPVGWGDDDDLLGNSPKM